MFVLSILIYFLAIMLYVFSASDNGYMMYIVDAPTLFFFLMVITAVIISTGGFKTFISAVNALLSKKYNISAADKEKSIRLFKLLGKSVMYAMVIQITIQLMQILHQMDDPSALGPSIAIAFIAGIHGAGINLIFTYPAINILQTRYNVEEKRVISEKQVINKMLELCYKQGITPEEIIDASEISFTK